MTGIYIFMTCHRNRTGIGFVVDSGIESRSIISYFCWSAVDALIDFACSRENSKSHTGFLSWFSLITCPLGHTPFIQGAIVWDRILYERLHGLPSHGVLRILPRAHAAWMGPPHAHARPRSRRPVGCSRGVMMAYHVCCACQKNFIGANTGG